MTMEDKKLRLTLAYQSIIREGEAESDVQKMKKLCDELKIPYQMEERSVGFQELVVIMLPEKFNDLDLKSSLLSLSEAMDKLPEDEWRKKFKIEIEKIEAVLRNLEDME